MIDMLLCFVPSKFPRSITKAEWKEIWRWKRTTEKILKAELDRQMLYFRTYGSTWPANLREDFMDKISRPPLLIHNKQQL